MASLNPPSRGTLTSRASRSSSPRDAPSGACSSNQWVSIPPPEGGGGGGVRHELGDAFITPIADARAAALKAKALVRQGQDPHRQAMVFRASAVAERSMLPTTLIEAL